MYVCMYMFLMYITIYNSMGTVYRFIHKTRFVVGCFLPILKFKKEENVEENHNSVEYSWGFMENFRQHI